MECIYCKSHMQHYEKPTKYELRLVYKCPCCDFDISYPSTRPDDVTLHFPSEDKLNAIKKG